MICELLSIIPPEAPGWFRRYIVTWWCVADWGEA